ncbi:hypothetical protein HAHE_40720 [Haloferula helveola]|uniref:Cytochrome c domain-containing protein n=1 Tax=Haloferula helveola TaxID=490095 RepID=A0ABN6H9I0_9BACT|nr:hypothetical protein HAHE_40720 [Haloferula helveola]
MRIALITLALALPLFAQRGDRKGHDNMEPVVPENLIPPAPVLDVDAALKTFKLQPGFVIEPVAAEPLVEKPVCMDFDSAGRMWVCEMRGYMPDIDGKEESIPQGRIVVLEDKDGDGKAETRTVFLDKLLLPRSVAIYEDGILFIDEMRLCWVKRDGLKPSGDVEVIDAEFAKGGNVEHKPNGLLWNLDNWLYLAKSDKRIRRINGKWEIEKTQFRGQWGIARDDYGRLYHNNNSTFLVGDLVVPNLLTGNPNAKMKVNDTTRLGTNRVWPIRVTPAVNRAYMDKRNGYSQQTLDPKTHKLINCTAAAGMTVYRGTNFPEAWKDTAFVSESTANLVKAIKIEDKDGKLTGSHLPGETEFLASTDERFRPVNLYSAPDGSLYLVDMYHGIIQHKTYMTSYLREQTLSRGLDKPGYGHGRIYRIRAQEGQLEKPEDLAGLSPEKRVALLSHPNAWHREMAQRLIVQSDPSVYAPLLRDQIKPDNGLGAIHSIWCLEGLGVLEANDLLPVFTSTEAKLRASALWAATRLPDSQLGAIASALASSKGDGESLPYRAKVLGKTGDPAALEALAKLLLESGKQPFVREAAVAGLSGHERSFIDSHPEALKDKQLKGWLEQAAKAPSKKSGPNLKGAALASYGRGKELYHGEAACVGCHGADGAGLPNLGPPLDGSEWVTGDPERLLKILLHGMTGPVKVAGETYNPPAAMPGLSFNPAMTDARLADITTYIRNEWDNKASAVEAGTAKKVRAATAERSGRPWTADELK